MTAGENGQLDTPLAKTSGKCAAEGRDGHEYVLYANGVHRGC